MTLAEELQKLAALKAQGSLSDTEFAEAKASLLARGEPAGARMKKAVDDMVGNVNNWCMLIHLSQFAGYVVPVAGWAVPLVLWLIKKDESPLIDRHGRIVMNWLITQFILGLIFGALSLVLIGIPLLIGLMICGVIFPIVGGVKASAGEVWRYPGAIPFLGTD